jgi:hypothetical protein
MNYFPDNKISHYTTKLATSLAFTNGEYEIGLSDFQYVHSWNNITRDEGDMEVERVSSGARFRATLKEGYYSTPQMIVSGINGLLSMSSEADIVLSLDEITQKVKIDVGGDWAIAFSQVLTSMLGLSSILCGPGIHYGDYVVDIDRGFHAMYIYCSIIKNRIVGDITAQLLKVVPKKGKHGEVIYMSFNNIQYHEIQCSNVGEVTIHITTDNGESVPFERGKCVATLAYRRKGFVS